VTTGNKDAHDPPLPTTTAKELDAMIAEVWLYCATTESMDSYRALREFHLRLLEARARVGR
jgi:hypothetical protein